MNVKNEFLFNSGIISILIKNKKEKITKEKIVNTVKTQLIIKIIFESVWEKNSGRLFMI